MKVKIYIFRKNSPWGIIKKPISGNEYKHVINFVDDTPISSNFILGNKQLEFINDYLMETGKDFKTEILKQPNKILTPNNFINERVFRYKIDLKEFGNINFDRLLNADYGAVLKTDGDKTYIDFYSLKVLGCEGSYINFEFELDVPFTFQPFKFKQNTSNFMLRGHIDRLFKNRNNLISIKDYVFTKKEDLDLTPTNFNNRVLENVYAENDEVYKNIKCAVLYFLANSESGETRFKVQSFNRDGKINENRYDLPDTKISKSGVGNEFISLPYKIFLVPFLDGSYNRKICLGTDEYGDVKYTAKLDYIINEFMVKSKPSGVQLLKVHILDYFPLQSFRNSKDSEYVYLFPTYDPALSTTDYTNVRLVGLEGCAINITRLGFKRYTETHNKNFSFESNDIWLNLPNFTYYVNNCKKKILTKRIIDFEPKIFSPQYYKIALQKLNSNSICNFTIRDIYDLETGTTTFNVSGIFSFIPEKYTMLYFLKKKYYKENNKISKVASIAHKTAFLVENEYQIPLKTSKYADYIQQHSNSLAAARQADKTEQFMRGIPGVAGGAMGGGKLGFSMGSVLGPIGSVAGTIIGAFAGASIGHFMATYHIEKRAMMREATIDDIKNSPTSILTNDINGVGLISQLPNNVNKLMLSVAELNKEDKKVLSDYLFKYGYKYNKIIDLNKIINSRYFFNYIEAIDTFNTIDTSNRNMSTTIKQNIDDLYANGVFIWHYRNKENWNGIMNFNYENIEMSLL